MSDATGDPTDAARQHPEGDHATGAPGDLSLERGMRVRREVLGDAHVDAAAAAATSFSAPFQEFITRVAWGGPWTRSQLDRRTRSCITLAILTALRSEDELALHVRAAARNGLSPEEIREVLLHSAVYAGVPAANAAFRVAERVLAETSGEPPTPDDGEPRAG